MFAGNGCAGKGLPGTMVLPGTLVPGGPMTDILEQLPFALQDLFLELPDSLNRDLGFIQRRRQISPSCFVRTLVFGWLDDPKAGVADLAEYATSMLGSPISESGLRGHFTASAVALLSDLLDRAL